MNSTQAEMTLEEALAIIDAVCAAVQGTRADHQKIAEALAVVKKAAQP